MQSANTEKVRQGLTRDIFTSVDVYLSLFLLWCFEMSGLGIKWLSISLALLLEKKKKRVHLHAFSEFW